LGVTRRDFLKSTAAAALVAAPSGPPRTRRYLYVAEPGIRNDVSYGGIGILVFDCDDRYRFVRRIPTWRLPDGQAPENVKGIAASAVTGRLYVTTLLRLGCFDLLTDRMLWDRALDGGCDRLAISPDGARLYVPSFEGAHWNVVDARTGDSIAKISTNSGAHNTVWRPDGSEVYLAGLHSPLLAIADPGRNAVVRTVGPFGNSIRPFTINGSATRCFVNVNELLGFEVGDPRSGAKLHRIVVNGFAPGEVKRHGCPSHGVGLTPDERELWLCDGHNARIHVFDATRDPPVQQGSFVVRDQPGWISFSIDGRRAYPSTGEVFDTRSKTRIAALTDESGRAVGSEKLLEVVFEDGRVTSVGNQFGVGGRHL
jgi:DNA-binding beta-propeller fold protein YncE